MIGLDILNTSFPQPPSGETPWWEQLYPGATLAADFQNNRAMVQNQSAQVTDFLTISRNSEGHTQNQNGSLTLFGNDELRTGTSGVLIESLTINRLINSQDITGTGWTTSGSATVSTNQSAAPDGTQSADQIQNLQSTGDGIIYTDPNSVAIANTTYTASIYLKADSPGSIEITLDAASGTSSPTTITADVTTDWQRYVITHTFNSDNNDYTLKVEKSASTTLQSLYIWGAQVEQKNHASSLINTTGTQKIRYADSISFSDLSWLDTTKGTILMNVQSDQGTITNRRLLGFASAQGLDTSPASNVVEEWNGNTLLAASTPTENWISGTKVALSWNTNNRSLCIGGGAVSTDNETVNGLSSWYLGSRDGSQSFWEGYHRQLVYWDERLSDTEIQALTV